MQSGQTLAQLLGPYRSEAVGEAAGTTRQTAHSWKTGSALPDVRFLPALATLLRIDLADLTRAVADESAQRASAVA